MHKVYSILVWQETGKLNKLTIPISKDSLFIIFFFGVICVVIGLLILAAYILIMEDGRTPSIIFGVFIILFTGFMFDTVFLGMAITDTICHFNPFKFKTTRGRQN